MDVSLNYTYRCSECKNKYDVLIGTTDIMDSQGRIDQEKLSMRMYSARECECGGELHKIIEHTSEALWFEAGIGKGKISQRFK